MKGTLAVVGQLFGRLALVQDGGTVIELIGPMLVYRGDAATYRLTVTDDADARVNLTGAVIEVQVKPAIGAADPPTIAKAVGTGVTLLDQVAAATKGQADVAFLSADTTQTPGLYWIDVVVDLGDGRLHVVAPREYTIAGVVNGP